MSGVVLSFWIDGSCNMFDAWAINYCDVERRFLDVVRVLYRECVRCYDLQRITADRLYMRCIIVGG